MNMVINYRVGCETQSIPIRDNIKINRTCHSIPKYRTFLIQIKIIKHIELHKLNQTYRTLQIQPKLPNI